MNGNFDANILFMLTIMLIYVSELGHYTVHAFRIIKHI